MVFSLFSKGVVPPLKRVWIVGGSVLVVGGFVKYYYFEFSRGMVLDGMTANHLKAQEHLSEARRFASWSQQDRSERLPELTDEQRIQLREYMALVAERDEKQYYHRPVSIIKQAER